MTQKLAFLFCLLPFLCHSQQKTFYNKFHIKVDSAQGYDSYEIVKKQKDGLIYVTGFRPNDTLLFEGAYSVYTEKVPDNIKQGLHKNYFRDGATLWYTQNYKAGQLDGELRSYYPGGHLKRLELYENGEFIKGDCYQEDGSPREFTRLERAPAFPGGEDARYKFLSDSLKYPEKALYDGIQGSVILTFVVNKDGSVSDIHILKDPGGGCGQEAFRLMKSMPHWIPGYFDDNPVKVRFTLPLKFKLEDRKKKKRKKD